VKITAQHLDRETIDQYQTEERALIANRVRVSHGRFNELMEVMREDLIAPDENVTRLGQELAEYHGDARFLDCDTMGDLLHASIQVVVQHTNRPATAPLLIGPH
jgi:hypothetical protein